MPVSITILETVDAVKEATVKLDARRVPVTILPVLIVVGNNVFVYRVPVLIYGLIIEPSRSQIWPVDANVLNESVFTENRFSIPEVLILASERPVMAAPPPINCVA
jgi:hypothetical protein